MQTTFYPGSLTGTIAAPPSKSEAHRRMICAGLTRGTTRLEGCGSSGDIAATARCLTALGASCAWEGEDLTVTGFARKADLLPVYDCGESGSTLRFMLPIALALTHGGVFRMHGGLSRRPMDIYRDLFVPRGVLWRMGEGADGAAELTVTGSLVSGSYTLPGNVSSQFASGLLYALPMLEGDSTLTVTPPVASAGYIAMTVQALRASGIKLDEAGACSWRIRGRQRYQAQGGRLDGDWSQAAVALAMGALGGDVTVTGLPEQTLQPDSAILACLHRLGADVETENGAVRAHGGTLRAAVLDMDATPDIAPVVALVCQMAEGESRLMRCGRLRLKESDRLGATVRLLNDLGGDIRAEGDDLVIRGVRSLKGGRTADIPADHRVVMLASAAALRADGPVTVTVADALAKSWPGYLDAYRALGGKAE